MTLFSLRLFFSRDAGEFSNLFHAFVQAFFQPFAGGTVVSAVAQIIWQTLHVGNLVFEIMRVLIASAIADILHQTGRRIAQMKRHRFGSSLLHILLNRAIGGVQSV